MRQQIIVAIFVVLLAVSGVGLMVVGSQKGMFDNQSKRLLKEATKSFEGSSWSSAREKYEEFLQTNPDSPMNDQALLNLGITYQEEEKWEEAKATFKQFMDKYPDSSLINEVQERLGEVNVATLFSPIITDYDAAYEVQPGDTLAKIANLHNTTIDLVKMSNGLKTDIIRPKQQLKIPAARFEIVVDKSQKRLLLTQGGEFVKVYPIATGRNDSTPEGEFVITSRIPNPVWYNQGAVVPPDSDENVLGSRWLGFDKEGYGIHGTVETEPIQQQQTAGCVRMNNGDVEELFSIIPVGTKVTIVN